MSEEDGKAFEINTKGLDQLMKAINGKLPSARVGILGSKTVRNSDGPNNATIGAAHEFGTTTLPMRSFLRMPISRNLKKKMESAGAFTKEAAQLVIQQGSLLPWMKKVAVLAEACVLEAFDSGGFGEWQASNMAHKQVKQTLVETQQLRNSITSEVKE